MRRVVVGMLACLVLCVAGRAGAISAPDPVELLSALRRADHANLERALSPLVTPADRSAEHAAARAFSYFTVRDEGLTAHFDAWVSAHPDSAAALLARARHLQSIAWLHRGGGYASATDDQRFEQFGAWYERARADWERALGIAPAAQDAWAGLLGMARDTSGDCAALYAASLRHLPTNIRLAMNRMACLDPLWGGSYKAAAVFLREFAERRPDESELGLLRGIPYTWAGRQARRDGDRSAALALYKQALGHARFAGWHSERAEIYLDLDQPGLALEETEAGLALYPDSTDLLANHGRALLRLDRAEESRTVLLRASAIDWTQREVRLALLDLIAPLEQRGRAALEADRWEEAERLFGEAIHLAPTASEPHYLRGWTRLRRNELPGAERDLRAAIALKPIDRRFVVSLDRALTPQGRWDEIVAAWDVYLRYVPEDAEGYFERSGTHWNRGDRPAALADARKACSLGRKMGCLNAARMWTIMATSPED